MAAPVAPYSGPWLGPDKNGKIRYRGPAAIAFKRTISRGWMDLIPWRSFNESYNTVLDDAVEFIQRQYGLTPTSGNIAMPMFQILRKRKVPAGKPHAGEWAMDPVSVRLLEDAYDIKYPPELPIEVVREALTEFLGGIEDYRGRWDYTQRRPYSSLGREPSQGGDGDCSSTVMLAYFEARQDTGYHVPDPSGLGYSGYGNSQSIWERHRHSRMVTNGKYEVGDCAVYGPWSGNTTHITTCSRPGTAGVAVFTSHGSMAGPNATRLTYRSDLLGVVRPPLLPA